MGYIKEWRPREGSSWTLDPERFLFRSDLVSRHDLPREHYVSRYWCQRTLWESAWEGRSPIADPDYALGEDGATTPLLRGLDLPAEVLRKVYHENARRILAPIFSGISLQHEKEAV